MRNASFLFSGAILVAAALGACYSGSSADADGTGSAGSAGGGSGGSAGGGTGGSAGGATECLPADVTDVLARNCWACHGVVPAGGAPTSLVTLADLEKAAPANGTYAQDSLVKVQDGTMPPGGGVSSADVATLSTWVNGGAPGVACESGTGDAGAGDSGSGGAGGDPYDTPSTCTSGTKWTSGNQGSKQMNPGKACIQCHDQQGGPGYPIAGTVYPTAHEPDLCNGATGITVVVEDASHKQAFTMTTNTAGNFYANTQPPAGFHVKVTANGMERAMSATPATGDCNTCHTETGTNSAPGRIMAP
jgi:cytochrome c553